MTLINRPTGGELDRLAAKLWVTRAPGESDEDLLYRVRQAHMSSQLRYGTAADYVDCAREHGAKWVQVTSPATGEVRVRVRWWLRLPLRERTRARIERALREMRPVNVRLEVL